MSCCGGNCGCSSSGSGCKCGSGCGGCKMYPDLNFFESTTTTETLVMGLAPRKQVHEVLEFAEATENGCNHGGNYTRVPCKCPK